MDLFNETHLAVVTIRDHRDACQQLIDVENEVIDEATERRSEAERQLAAFNAALGVLENANALRQ